MRLLETCIVSAALAASLSAQWAQLTPATSPSQRRAGACAFDGPNNRLIFYGGVTATPALVLAETWAFNGTWTQLTVPTVARWGHQMVRNTQNNRLITFGGRSPTISGFANDTYEWTGSAWATVATANAPSPRYLYGLAFDQTRNVAVLFGGRNNNTTLGDVWEYDGTNWTARTFAATPEAREEMVLVYDPSLGRTVLFGGYDRDTDTLFNDTWHYDGLTWVEQATTSPPSPRHRCAAVYDPRRLRIVLYGGYTGTTVEDDTYEYTGSDWNAVATTTQPANSTETLHGYDTTRGKFVLFGGFGTSFSNQTWEYTGANRGTFSTYGVDCPPPAVTVTGPLTIASTTPTTNQPWSVTYGNSDPLNVLLVIAAGLSNPPPVDLGFLGLPGCSLFTAADFIDVKVPTPSVPPAAGNEAVMTINIPNTAALVNTRVFQQAVAVNGSFAFVGTSKAVRAVIGSL